MTGTELDDILADDTPQEQEQTTTEGPTRDEQGRFAAKVEQTETQQAPETTVEPQAEHVEGSIPPSAIAAARAKARDKENENEQLRRELAELRGHVQALSTRPPVQPANQEPEKEVNFWDNPDDFIGKALSPVQQQLAQQQERFSRMLAVTSHGAERVAEAEQAFNAALSNLPPQEQSAAMAKLRASPDMYGEVLQWHSRQKTLQKVGNDPDAWLEAEMEKRLADPAYQAKVLERIQGTAAANTDRSNPSTKLPPSLSRLPSGGTQTAGSMNDAALFSHAMR